ncbi:zinc-binding dehydrogenase [Sinomonas sp. JGH33]|uniref:Zinc-binding dehydrogenase n=1 Tax=Sinomonas terricola TaxID=3110330 RepID=A0ABU5T0Q6_9MICC|nr:zinc-binding dehydrogenase [Sinomonas sp. JGH33]MEA5453233.1 zinc-binding dehydrogenase [Sinomonas sp. JGH33]
MRAIVHRTFGEPTEVLLVEDVPTPAPGPGEVLVRTVLAAVHNHDLWTVRGTYGFKPELPARAGTEALGIVEALGQGVTGLAVGRRVVTGGTFGVWAEAFTAPAAALVPVPDDIPDEAAAQLISMPFSALSLVDSLGLGEGDLMVQNTANGAVGRLVAQFAAARGIGVIGLVRRTEGIAELAAQGIGRVVATDNEGWREEVAALAGGAPISVGIDSIGGAASGEVLSLLAEGGTLVAFGAMGSPRMDLASRDVIFKQATVKGFWGSRISAAMPAERRAELVGEVFRRVASGEATLPVYEIFAFDDVRDAAHANFDPGHVGKVLLRP